MHSWGEENVDWTGIHASAELIGIGCRKWGRISVYDYKEKFGTVRVYVSFGIYDLHTLLYPGYHFMQFPKWLYNFNHYSFYFFRPFNPLITMYQISVYRYFYYKAVKLYPHLKEEILLSADHTEYLDKYILRTKLSDRHYTISLK